MGDGWMDEFFSWRLKESETSQALKVGERGETGRGMERG